MERYMEQEPDIPIRICQRCKKTEMQLIEQLCDLCVQQDTIKFDFTQTEQKYVCQKCLRKGVESKKGTSKRANENLKHWKPVSVIKFEKQQRERQTLDKTKHIPTLVIQILMHFRFKNQNIFIKEHDQILKFEKAKEQEQHIIQHKGSRQVYPKYITKEQLGDGKDSSGYREDWQKGISQIIDAFNSSSFCFK